MIGQDAEPQWQYVCSICSQELQDAETLNLHYEYMHFNQVAERRHHRQNQLPRISQGREVR